MDVSSHKPSYSSRPIKPAPIPALARQAAEDREGNSTTPSHPVVIHRQASLLPAATVIAAAIVLAAVILVVGFA